MIETGEIHVNLDDHGIAPGLAFCDNRPEYFLIPDPPYLGARGYEQVRAHYARNDVVWEQRRPVAMWRGGTSGQPADPSIGWRSLPRIRLCEIGREYPDIIDAGITGIAQMPNARAEEEIRNSRLMAGFLPVKDFNRFRYRIDIDGNSNSWPGLFQKLLTGSPVLKVASPRGFRQWYCDRLKPWINFVPVAVDMSDLVEKAEWLKAHDDAAHQIGQRGRASAESLDYSGELKSSGRTIGAALRCFSGRPEAVLRFGTTEDDNVHLGGGWSRPEADGVAAVAQESRLELPRPIAVEDFLLTLDVSPVTRPAMPATQRLSCAGKWRATAPGNAVRKTGSALRSASPGDRPSREAGHHAAASGRCVRCISGAAAGYAGHECDASSPGTDAAQRAWCRSRGHNGANGTGDTHTSQRQGAVMRALYGRDIWHGFAPCGRRAPEIQGWNGRYLVFGRLLEEIPNPTMIDVAVWKGPSTIFVAELMRRRRIDGCVTAVDTFWLKTIGHPTASYMQAIRPAGQTSTRPSWTTCSSPGWPTSWCRCQRTPSQQREFWRNVVSRLA